MDNRNLFSNFDSLTSAYNSNNTINSTIISNLFKNSHRLSNTKTATLPAQLPSNNDNFGASNTLPNTSIAVFAEKLDKVNIFAIQKIFLRKKSEI